MKIARLMYALAALLILLAQGIAQETPGKNDMPGMVMEKPANTQHDATTSLLPEIGEQGSGSGPTYQLGNLEAKALRQNPTLTQADAALRGAAGRKAQAGMWPNPTVGYLGDEIAGGAGVNGGRQGGFVEQTIILGRKLYLAQQVAGSDVRIAALEKEEQRFRVQNAVRAAYFETLAAQELATLAQQYVKLAAQTLETSRRLRNAGSRDQSEVAMAEIDLERAKLSADVQRSHLQAEWENLCAVIGEPALPRGHLAGKLDAGLPQLDSEQAVNALIADSPVMKIVRENAVRTESSTLLERRQAVPDLRVRAGLEQNFERNDFTGMPFGLEGFAEVKIELPIFNRNQGGVVAAAADAERSKAEIRRVELLLRQQAAATVEQYQSARAMVERYQTQILPRTRQLYDMQLQAWGRMALSYPQVLQAQQSLFTAQAEYIHALQNLRTTAVALNGFLLTNGLTASTTEGRTTTAGTISARNSE